MLIDRVISILRETAPTNSGGNPQAFSQAANDAGPVAGFDKKLFPSDMDLSDQGFQIIKVRKDDSCCMPKCISVKLYGSTKYHLMVRK